MRSTFRLKPLPVPEHEVQAAILRYLAVDRRVAWARRANSGAVLMDRGTPSERMVTYGWKGCADILGMLATGHFLAIECKSRTGRASESQREFLAQVTAAGGLAILARSIDDVKRGLDEWVAKWKDSQPGR